MDFELLKPHGNPPLSYTIVQLFVEPSTHPSTVSGVDSPTGAGPGLHLFIRRSRVPP